jgi:hypothetical protein
MLFRPLKWQTVPRLLSDQAITASWRKNIGVNCRSFSKTRTNRAQLARFDKTSLLGRLIILISSNDAAPR